MRRTLRARMFNGSEVVMRFTLVASFVVAVTVAVGWALRWEHRTLPINGRPQEVRIHRFTGDLEVWSARGWRQPEERASRTAEPCSPETLARGKDNPYILRFCSALTR